MKFFEWIKSLLWRSMPEENLIKAGAILRADKVNNFHEKRLNGQEAPIDLDTLLAAIARDPEFEKSDNNPLNIIGAEILWTDREYPLLDHSYINDTDRADPNIMANVKAMQDTDKKLRFVVQCQDTSLIGYWQLDPDNTLDRCALFWLDTEGQYYLAEGKTLSESLAYQSLVAGDKDTYEALRNAFERLNIPVPQADEANVFADMDSKAAMIDETPEKFRDKRYQHYASRK